MRSFSTQLATLAFALLALAHAPAHAQQTIAFGAEVQGQLSANDPLRAGGARADAYTFTGRAGQRVSVAMRSSNLDAFLVLTGPGGFSLENDDDPAGATLNARIDATLPANGQYRIEASSYAAGATGAYTLALTQGASQGQSAAAAQSSGSSALRLGQNVAGELRAGDLQIESGEYADIYTLQGVRGQNVEIRLTSSAFDPYVMIRGPGGFQHDNDDDVEAGGTNSRLFVTLPQDGEYRIQATSYASGETGRYQLSVAEASGPPPPEQASSGARGAPIAFGQQSGGRLEAGDATLQSGEFADVYRFLGQRGQRVAIDMSSTALDPYLILVAPSGAQEDNDDAPGGGVNARIETVLEEDGEYEISATTFEPGESGAYDLLVSALDSADRDLAEAAPSPSGQRLTLSRPAQGRLETGDTTLESGEFIDSWSFQGRAGQVVTFEMTSSDVDSYLMVVAPSGEQQDNDDADAEAGLRDARVVWRLPENGAYRVVATTYASGETGAYRLTATAGGTETVAAPAAQGRVYALMVGISDYAGEASNLAFTADDARNLAQTLRAKGVLAPESVVLTDAQATRGAVQDAFQRLSAQAGPDDLFLFFYSGHGSQTDETASSREADRREESIVLRDGEISDDEMAVLFGGLNTRMSVIALDSCFSGGFARDVVDRPGVMGLFSSEEDLTSAIADKFRAGGYLSHFLRTGFDGEADGDGDTAITVGELSTYLWRRFATEVENEEAVTSRGQRNYQRLVVDRGGVKIDDVVLALN